MYLVLGQVRAGWLAATLCSELDTVNCHSLCAQHVHVAPMLDAGGVLFTAKFMTETHTGNSVTTVVAVSDHSKAETTDKASEARQVSHLQTSEATLNQYTQTSSRKAASLGSNLAYQEQVESKQVTGGYFESSNLRVPLFQLPPQFGDEVNVCADALRLGQAAAVTMAATCTAPLLFLQSTPPRHGSVICTHHLAVGKVNRPVDATYTHVLHV